MSRNVSFALTDDNGTPSVPGDDFHALGHLGHLVAVVLVEAGRPGEPLEQIV